MAAQSCAHCLSVPNQSTTAQGFSHMPSVGQLKFCRGCRTVRYCSKECQEKDLPLHKAWCKYRQRCFPVMSDATSLQTRVTYSSPLKVESSSRKARVTTSDYLQDGPSLKKARFTSSNPLQAGASLKKESADRTSDKGIDSDRASSVEPAKAKLLCDIQTQLDLDTLTGCGLSLSLGSPPDEDWPFDKEIVMLFIKADPLEFKHAGHLLRGDREVVLTAVKKCGRMLEYADPTLRGDREIVLAAVKQWGPALQYASPALRKDLGIAVAAVKEYRDAIRFVHPDLFGEKEIADTACAVEKVHKMRNALRTGTEADKGRKAQRISYIRYRLSFDFWAGRDFSLSLSCPDDEDWPYDKEIVMVFIEADPLEFEYVSPALKNDREVVLAAVKKCGRMLEYASPALRNNREIVLAAVENWGLALQYASPTLKDNLEIARTAVRQSTEAVLFVTSRLRKDKEISGAVWDLMKKDRCRSAYRKYGSFDNYKADYEPVKSSCPVPWDSNNPESVLANVKHNGLMLEFASDTLKKNKEIALAAVGQNLKAVDFVHRDLYKEAEIWEAYIIVNNSHPPGF